MTWDRGRRVRERKGRRVGPGSHKVRSVPASCSDCSFAAEWWVSVRLKKLRLCVMVTMGWRLTSMETLLLLGTRTD